MLSIIGASGAGKTTLLNYLSGKMSSHNLVATGEVLYNGIPRRQLDTKSLIAYVQQDDVLFEALTVKCKNLNCYFI